MNPARVGPLPVLAASCLLTVAAFGQLPLSPSPSPPPAALVDSLAAAERAFAAMSLQFGMKDAFLEFLAEDGVVFQPTATNGRKAWEARPASRATLTWEPEYAEVSGAGDLGYTTGPWELHPPADHPEIPVAFGHFISVWKKQADGSWRVAVDLGVSHDKPASGGVGSGSFAPGPAPARVGGGATDLAALDHDFGKATKSKGVADAFAALGTPDVRFNWEGAYPFHGAEAARAVLDRISGSLTFTTQGSGLADSRDLGYTYGLAEHYAPNAKAPADSSVYLHVWRKSADRKWRLALAVLNPLTPPGK